LEALAELADDPRPTCRTLRPGADIDGGLDALVEGTFAPVMLRDGCAGWLVLVTSAPPPPEHIALLSIGAASVAVVLAHERTMSQIELHASRELLHALLDVGSDVETIRRRAAGAGVNLRSVNAVMVIRSPDRASLPSRHPGLLTLARDTGSWLGDHDDEIVLLARGVSVEAIEERLRRLVPDFESATAGIAVCTGGVEATREAYVSARQTALVLQALERDGAVVRGGELGIYQGLLSHAGRGDLREFVDATIGNLVRGDEERGRDLTRTVACYIANAQHHARTCADLHIHANTLYARLGRINDLMGPTWREPDRLLEIQLALRMRDLDTRIETGPHVRERMRELDPDD
jgi:sugar diacid utilization regulator